MKVKEFKLTIPGQPVPQGRPRFSSKPFPHAYDPKTSRDYKKLVSECAKRNKPSELFTGALEVRVDIYKKSLKSFNRAQARDAQAQILRPITKPDADNYAKGILDALKGIVWSDDGQVVKLTCEKFYSEEPRADISVRPLNNKEEK